MSKTIYWVKNWFKYHFGSKLFLFKNFWGTKFFWDQKVYGYTYTYWQENCVFLPTTNLLTGLLKKKDKNMGPLTLFLIDCLNGNQLQCRHFCQQKYDMYNRICIIQYLDIATLGSILNSQLSWESGKFQLARWSHRVALLLW